jgi:tetratricopeptide (TPR) repeat protein
LEARIDRLPAVEKHLLQAAAVVATPCSIPLLGTVFHEIPQRTIYWHLLRLTSVGLLEEIGPFADSLYVFKHSLIQEVAYDALPLERRRHLHGAVLLGIELVYAARRAEYVEILAYHADRAEIWGKLAVYARDAGRKAAGQSAYPEAIRYFEQALSGYEQLPQSPQLVADAIETRFELRGALFPLGQIERDLTNLHQAEQLAAELGDPSKLAWIASYMARDLSLRGRWDEATAASQRALALARQIGDTDLRAVTRSYIGQVHCALGEYRQSADIMRDLIQGIGPRDLGQRAGLPFPAQVLFRCWLIWALSPLGPSPELEDGLAAVLKAAAAVDQPLSETVARYSCGFALVNQERIDEAISYLEEALRLCRRWDLTAWFRRIASCLGYAYARAGRAEDGLGLIDQAVQRSRTLGKMPGQACEIAWLGEAQLVANLVDEARSNAGLAICLARRYREKGHEAVALCLSGQVALRAEPLDRGVAERTIRASLDLAESLGMQPLLAKSRRLLMAL